MLFDLDKLNSATKYPPIPTFHAIDSATGNLLEDEPTVFSGTVIGTEKVDGTNARIIRLPGDDWLIGTREEIIYARGDRIRNPELSIVPTLIPIAEGLADVEDIRTYYFEVYGGAIGGAWRNYTTDKTQTGARLFDIATMPEEVYSDVLSRPRDHIALWRQHGGQSFLSFLELAREAGKEALPLVPHLFVGFLASSVPTSLQGMRDFLATHVGRSGVCLDEEANAKPEGLILRSPDRSTIVKARFQDYDRTLRRMSSQGKS